MFYCRRERGVWMWRSFLTANPNTRLINVDGCDFLETVENDKKNGTPGTVKEVWNVDIVEFFRVPDVVFFTISSLSLLFRLRIAQEIQRRLEEVEEKQKELEIRGVSLEKALRGETSEESKEEDELLQEWFELVRERNELRRYEKELLVRAQEMELEDRHARLQQELRDVLAKDGKSGRKPSLLEKSPRVFWSRVEFVFQTVTRVRKKFCTKELFSERCWTLWRRETLWRLCWSRSAKGAGIWVDPPFCSNRGTFRKKPICSSCVFYYFWTICCVIVSRRFFWKCSSHRSSRSTFPSLSPFHSSALSIS